MQKSDSENARRWMEAWKNAGLELERLRREDIRRADTQEFFDVMDGLLDSVLRDRPLRLESGLVEQQRLFGLMRSNA